MATGELTRRALAKLKANGVKGVPVATEQKVTLRGINFLGRYSFALTESIARGELRSLRASDEESPP
jgi:hypothetical protein